MVGKTRLNTFWYTILMSESGLTPRSCQSPNISGSWSTSTFRTSIPCDASRSYISRHSFGSLTIGWGRAYGRMLFCTLYAPWEPSKCIFSDFCASWLTRIGFMPLSTAILFRNCQMDLFSKLVITGQSELRDCSLGIRTTSQSKAS